MQACSPCTFISAINAVPYMHDHSTLHLTQDRRFIWVIGTLVFQPACKHRLKLVCQYLALIALNSSLGKGIPLLYNLTYACHGRLIQEYTMRLCEPQRCYRSYARGVTPRWTWAIYPPGPLQVNVHTSADLKQSTSIGQLSHLHCSSCKLICSRATATKEENWKFPIFQRQLNEKPSTIPSCPFAAATLAVTLSIIPAPD